MKILIAIDGSAHTQKAIDYLAKNRAMFIDGNELVVVHVCIGVPGHVTRHLSKEIVRDYYVEETAKVLGEMRPRSAKIDASVGSPTSCSR